MTESSTLETQSDRHSRSKAGRIIELLEEIRDELRAQSGDDPTDVEAPDGGAAVPYNVDEFTTSFEFDDAPAEDTETTETDVYPCEECGETFDSIQSLGGHVRAHRKDGGMWDREFGISNSNRVRSPSVTRRYLSLVDSLPSEGVTCHMMDPFVDDVPSGTLSNLHEMGVVEREGNGGRGDPYRYSVSDLGREILEEGDSDG